MWISLVHSIRKSGLSAMTLLWLRDASGAVVNDASGEPIKMSAS